MIQQKYFKDLRQMPVQSAPCRTCPFAGKEPIPLEPERYAQYLMPLVNGISQHLCHSADDKKVCRGGRDIQLRLLYCKGAISEPTDEAFNKAITQQLFPHELETESEQ
ncbi:hypothetical protein [Laspinema olomoucense]|uniref:Uncharacterized protein n=1 Tax=Laspinema olomoucense D3b TaxID=2953688 RepID=A0ABT2N4J6_9CYAN|nr:hypothetical protein [Laspinema sp. D3b]MCT7977583.1 hypothetical protein [Laspinema sp. D3b]